MLKVKNIRHYSIACDKCGTESTDMLTPEGATVMAKKHGWAIDKDKAKCKRCMVLEAVEE